MRGSRGPTSVFWIPESSVPLVTRSDPQERRCRSVVWDLDGGPIVQPAGPDAAAPSPSWLSAPAPLGCCCRRPGPGPPPPEGTQRPLAMRGSLLCDSDPQLSPSSAARKDQRTATGQRAACRSPGWAGWLGTEEQRISAEHVNGRGVRMGPQLYLLCGAGEVHRVVWAAQVPIWGAV